MKKKFKFTSLALCIVMLLSSFSTVAYAEDTAILGDVDGSGVVDTRDARLILRMAASIDEPNLALADLNGDGMISVDDAKEALIKASNIGGVVIPDKNGDNELSDDPNNEFIKLVVSNFNVDAKDLVAIYSVPDSGTNYVLQFRETIFNKGKSPDTLYRVYHIGLAPEREISYTSGSLLTGNYNCDAASGVLVFNLVQTQVMPQYPDYFEGV